jgi:hypothetical protein
LIKPLSIKKKIFEYLITPYEGKFWSNISYGYIAIEKELLKKEEKNSIFILRVIIIENYNYNISIPEDF